jgi:copper(I)-binding protein
MTIRILFTLLVLALPMAGHAGVADQIKVDDPYVRAVPPGQPNSASFMVLLNGDEQAHKLVDARSPVAKVVELHTHLQEDGMMKMRRVQAIELPAGETTTLAPGGLHVMLIGLQQKLVPGEMVALTLVFEDGSEVELQAPVRKVMGMMMKRGKMGH